MLKTYSSAIKMLTGWKPPLTLNFIKAPEREGWLEKVTCLHHCLSLSLFSSRGFVPDPIHAKAFKGPPSQSYGLELIPNP